MPSKKSYNFVYLSQLWLLIIVLLLGIFFRFANLESKVFWLDEVATSVRVAGYTVAEVAENLQAKDTVTAQDLLEYQVINSERNLIDTWQALTKSPEHAPLYFLLTRLWLDLWGYSISIIRSLSAYFSLLVLFCIYWLLEELFHKSLVNWIGVMLMSISPFYVAYAQEARPYSLWTVTILLIGASFLRTIKFNSWQSWLVYIISLVFGFYTSLLSFFVVCFQGFYLLLSKLKNKRQLIKNYLNSNAIALLFFSPWLYIMITGMQTLQDNTIWMRSSIDISALIATWIGTILLIFADLPLSSNVDPIQMAIVVIFLFIVTISLFLINYYWHKFQIVNKKNITYLGLFSLLLIIGAIYFSNYFAIDSVTFIGAIVAIFILSLASYSLYFTVINSQQKQWLFIICLLLSLPIPLLLFDFISQGQSSGAPRYLIPSQLAIQMATAYTVGTKLETSYLQLKQQQIWTIILILFLTLGVYSCTRNLNLSPIYLKSRNIFNSAIAKVINRYPHSLVVVEPVMINDILSISHDLSEQVKIKAIKHNDDSFLGERKQFSYLYILKPSIELKTKLAKNSTVTLQLAYQPKLLTPGQIALDLWLVKSK